MPPDEESLGFIFLRAPRLDQEVDGAGESTQIRARSDTGTGDLRRGCKNDAWGKLEPQPRGNAGGGE